MKLSFSLSSAKPKTTPTGAAPPLKQPVAFASLGDDEAVDAAPTASSSRGTAANKQLIAQKAAAKTADGNIVKLSKAARKRIEEEKRVDETVFEYDEVWDKMQLAKQKQKEVKAIESKERKPKYIKNLLQSATTRKLDYLRAEEKMIQREREAEGDEFVDKDQFVTQAYKDQMAEVRRAEEEEKKREEMERNKKGATTGMTHFYAQMLKQSEEQHNATVAATLPPTAPTAPTNGGKPIMGPAALGPQMHNLTITKPVDFSPVSDAELAKRAREEGKEIELNDDNQIVDKRELLSAGLNLSAPNTRRLALLRAAAAKDGKGADKGAEGSVNAHRAVGTAASRREINERRLREIERQAEEEKDRARVDRDREEHERTMRVVTKRNTDEDVISARERYLARKRQKLEAPTAATDGAVAVGDQGLILT